MNKLIDTFKQTADRIAFLDRGYGINKPDVQSAIEQVYRRNTLDIRNVQDYGAIPDGKTDVTASVLAAIDSVNGKGGIYFPAGDYLVDGEIVIDKEVYIFSHGATIIHPNADKNVFIINADNSIVEGFNVEATWETLESNDKGNFVLTTGNNIRISNNNLNGCGIVCNTGKNILINGNHIKGNGISPGAVNYGVQIYDVINYQIMGNVIYNFNIDGIKVSHELYVEEGEPSGRYGIISNNIIFDCVNDDAIDLFAGGLYVVISNNIIYNCSKAFNIKDWGPEIRNEDALGYVRKVIVEGNIIHECSGTAVIITASNVVISNNYFDNVSKGIWAAVTDPVKEDDYFNLLISNNIIRNTVNESIHIGSNFKKNLNIIGNIIENGSTNPGSTAILVSSGENVVISDCNINNNDGRGIQLTGVNKGIIKGCIIRQTDPLKDMEYGIRLSNTTSGVLVVDNIVEGASIQNFQDDAQDSTTEASPNRYYNNSFQPSYGKTSERPPRQSRYPGYVYYDTDENRLVVRQGGSWTPL